MAFPFQCLVAKSTDSNEWTLVGASGSKLIVQSSKGAAARSVWPQEHGQVTNLDDHEAEERPGKRVKLSAPQEPKSNFTCLVISSNGHYLVGVTGEDKCIRVFQIDSQSRLLQLSERCMTRRPSSITLTSDDATILCADKFGDVYALPLLPSPDDERPATPVETPATEESEPKDFAPAATVLTVHSGRNRRTLEEQLKQKAKGPPKPKEIMTFRHDLLLGHVSMLTDLAYAKVDSRSYIITSDRDEHIRISRGQPQAHVIEGFCFGHEEFISKLCLTRSGLLVSGGGDSCLFVWDWLQYRLVERLPIRDITLQFLKSRPESVSSSGEDTNLKVAVTGIWDVPNNDTKVNEVLVTCEGIPALFSFQIGTDTPSGRAIPLDGNALDVAVMAMTSSSSTIIVSVDNVHKPWSKTEVQEDKVAPRLQYFSHQADGQWREDAHVKEGLEWFAEQGSEVQVERGGADETLEKSGPRSADDKALRGMLYHVENLRKRPGAED